jgi:hypothetical protein
MANHQSETQDYSADDIDIDEANERLKRAKASAKAKEKAEKAEQRQGTLLAAAEEFVAERDRLFFVAKNGLYGEWAHGEWHWMTEKALATKNADVFTIDGFAKAFKVAMQHAGRCSYDCTHSFGETPGKLNLLIRDNWLRPMEGEHHWFFDRLMQSIGGGKSENVEHLERVIAYKIEHPECVTLPAILMNGEGNLGKNLLVETILARIWDGAVLSATAGNIIGQFNSLAAGMLAILINETSPKRVDHDELKHRLQRDTLEINCKGVPQYQTANLALYFISSNRKAGGVWLDRTKADRRFSVFHIDAGLDLIHWIRQEKSQWDADMAQNWMDAEGMRIARDPREVAKWINRLLTKYAGQTRPRALHGRDYRRLLNIQMPVDEDIIPAVFCDPKFTHVSRQTLYEGYQLRSRAEGREPMSSRLFYEAARTYLRLNPDLLIPENEADKRQGKVTPWVWIKKGYGHVAHESNDHLYIEQEGYVRRWIGPVSE